ncbi:glycosyltransferase [Shimia thalassica]|uniref:glycosyltransferase n=1 Tax=Shimia thalassica TaxID=1715693 RepID=UPI0026E47AB5|nr:glycosyltransferase [Shimia thalassica]MDO6522974.1 glycosyltransferase [Shimia thalassica]
MSAPETHCRIAYLTGEYPRATDTFIQREVAALRALGHEVKTCSIRRTDTDHHVGPEQRAEAQATFHVLAAAKNPFHLIRCHAAALVAGPARYFRALGLALRTSPPGLKALLYQLFYFLEAAVLTRHLHQNRIDHLHNHIAKSSCTVAMVTSEMSGIPYSFTLHGPDIFFAPDHWRLDKKIETASFVACISHFCRAQAMAFSDPSHWEKLHIVHCGVDPARYDFSEPAPETGELLFVGRLAGVKGVPLLLEVMAEIRKDIPAMRLTLAGDGPERTAIENRARDLGLSDIVTFLGYQSQEAVADLLKQSDMLVLPSFAEGVPVVLMEAMAARRPVVTTRIAGIPELVEEGISGRVVAAGDKAGLKEAITEILSAPETARAMGLAGRGKVVSEFNNAPEAQWLSDLIQGYLTNTPPERLRPNDGDLS